MSEAERCVIHALPLGDGRYKWWWSTASRREARYFFQYFYDCVADATANGCSVNIATIVEHLKRAEATDTEAALQTVQLQLHCATLREDV